MNYGSYNDRFQLATFIMRVIDYRRELFELRKPVKEQLHLGT